LTAKGQELRTTTGQTAEVYLLLLACYFALASVIAAAINLLERRVRRGIDAGSSQVAGTAAADDSDRVEAIGGSQAMGGVSA
jgi:hypothetical protein